MLFDFDKYGIGVAIVFALAGLGLFLTAVKLMSGSMKKMSSGFTTHLLKKFQKNTWVGLLFGVAFTTMIQSSDGTVALCIGLIGAGLLNLRGAIPILLGANIGTATTAIIVALGSAAGHAFEFIQYIPLLVFFGAAIMLFVKEERKMNAAMLVFAIGSIFLGLKVMGAGMDTVTSQHWFHSFTQGVGVNPWVALVANTGFTGVVQSSSATVTVVQHIYTYNGEAVSSMSLESAIAMVIGANIGTTFTALITSIGQPKDAKRIALVWLITNTFMALVIMAIIPYYADMVRGMSSVNESQMGHIHDLTVQHPGLTFQKDGWDVKYASMGLTKDSYNGYVDQLKDAESAQGFQLAWAHLFFNVFLVAIFIWLVTPLVKFTNWVIKDPKTNPKYEVHLTQSLVHESPELALQAAYNGANALGRMSEDYIVLCQEYLKEPDKKKYEEMAQLKALIEKTRSALYAYLVEIGTADISRRSANKQMSLVLAARSLEKIPLIASDIMHELERTSKKGELDVSVQTKAELTTLFAVILTMTTKASKQLGRLSQTRTKDIKEMNEYIDNITQQFSANYISRKEKHHEFDYLDTLKRIARISHHANRVNTYISRASSQALEVKQLSTDLEKEIMKGLV